MEIYYGVVEDVLDPKMLGRVKIRVVNVHPKDKLQVSTADLPWSLVMSGTTTPGISGLGHSSFFVQGAWVVGVFTDPDLQSFLVMGSIPSISGSETLPTDFGFNDPDGIYPRELSTGDNNTRVRGEEDPDKEFDGIRGKYQPYSTYNPKYPSNHVYETESGHLKEYDDTIGSERIREKHMSGTYYEIQSNGTKVERIERDNYQLVIGDDTIEVFGSVNVVCSQNVNLVVGGTLDAHVLGNIMVKGELDATVNIDGRVNIEAGEDIKIHTNENAHILADKDINIEASGAMHMKSVKDMTIETDGNMQLKATNIYLNE